MMPSVRFADLDGASVLITGGGSGIGAKLTEGFARQASKVAFIDIAEQPSQALCDEIEAATATRPLYLRADLRDISSLRAAVAKAGDAQSELDKFKATCGLDATGILDSIVSAMS